MIRKFNDFDKNVNEGLVDKMKKFLSPDIKDIIEKMKNDIDRFSTLLILADEGDIDAFLEYIDLCDKNLKRAKNLLAKQNLKEEEYEMIEKINIELVNAITHTFPKRFKFTGAPWWFLNQAKRILGIYEILAEEYNLKKMEFKIKTF